VHPIEYDLALCKLIFLLRRRRRQRELVVRLGTMQSVTARPEEGGGARNRIDTPRSRREALGRHLIVSFPEKVPAKLKDAIQVALWESLPSQPKRCSQRAVRAPATNEIPGQGPFPVRRGGPLSRRLSEFCHTRSTPDVSILAPFAETRRVAPGQVPAALGRITNLRGPNPKVGQAWRPRVRRRRSRPRAPSRAAVRHCSRVFPLARHLVYRKSMSNSGERRGRRRIWLPGVLWS
jgi:hypothetical protein